jgi:hypothetical protein
MRVKRQSDEPSNACQMKLGMEMDAHSGYYIQYSIDDNVSDQSMKILAIWQLY